MPYPGGNIIRVTPTLSTDAYADGDVLFTATEIPNAVKGFGGCSNLVSMFILDQSDVGTSDMQIIFSEGNIDIGAINATANISDSDLEALKINGMVKIDADQATSSADLDNATIQQCFPATGNGEQANLNVFLQAAAGSTSVYVQAILSSATTPTYAIDDIDLIFHIEY